VKVSLSNAHDLRLALKSPKRCGVNNESFIAFIFGSFVIRSIDVALMKALGEHWVGFVHKRNRSFLINLRARDDLKIIEFSHHIGSYLRLRSNEFDNNQSVCRRRGGLAPEQAMIQVVSEQNLES
jgi:hypothetical protein